MKKSITALAWALALALSLTACGGSGGALTGGSHALSSTPAESPSSNAPSGPSSSLPEAEAPAQEEETAAVEDAKIREILKTYGMEEADPAADGTPRLKSAVMGLIYHSSNWDRPEDLAPSDYYCWYLAAHGTEAFVPNPKGESYGSYLPREIMEKAVQEHFRVSVRHLRSDPNLYHEDLQGYDPGVGGGIGERPFITYTWDQMGAFLTIDFTLHYEYFPEDTYRLLVFLREDGGWEYMNCEYRPSELPREGGSWEEIAARLTPEQQSLIPDAETNTAFFEVHPASFPGDDGGWQSSNVTREIDGVTYTRYGGSVYKGWEDFRKNMLEVFTEDHFRQLNTKDFGLWPNWTEAPLYREVDGDLYFVDGARGGNLTYLPELDRWELQGEVEDRVYLCRWAYYCDPESVGTEGAKAVSVKQCPVTLEKTPEGWRVAEFALAW